jgi:RND superfamily putative drug exporter
VLLRAVVAAFLLIGTVVLSFGAALGLSALLFRHVFGFAGADTAMPLFVFVFLVALGIDYSIFLMTRVREESKRSGTRLGPITGLGATGGVITSAGLILAGTFATLSTLPLVILTEIGVTVAVGVLIDTVSSGRCWSPRSPWTSAGGCGGPAGWPGPRRWRLAPRRPPL